MRLLKALLVAAAFASALSPARGDGGDSRASLSRPMQLAIRFYEQGDDMQAMDRFMEILTQGDPTERSMANEYINLITHRMNSTGGGQGNPASAKPAAPAPAAPPAPKPAPAAVESLTPAKPAAAPASRAPLDGEAEPVPAPRRAAPRPATRAEEMSSSNKALMRKEIKARLRAAQERSVADLKAMDGVRVAMRPNGDPEAIGIPSSMLFQAGISFQRDASRVLDPLTKLVFALGSTQVLILPEGTVIGDAKVLDMRRTMGVSSALYQAGVAPPRVRVNLLNTQVDVPKSLSDFKGIVIVFQYDQPMNLSVENALGDELGPPISLGIFPTQIRPSRNQGAIVEFSVSDPPAGLVSWKFQLLQPSRDGAELAPLQEVMGGGPVFHQIFWNGRQNYFGSPLPAGRYECVLTALDGKNRQRALHKWIQVLPDASSGERMLASGTRAPVERLSGGAAPSADLGGSSKPLIKGVKAAAPRPTLEISSAAKSRKPKGKAVRRGVPAKKAAAPDKGRAAKTAEPAPAQASAAPAAKPAPSGAASDKPGRYELEFGKNTHQMTPASEKALAKAVRDLASYPLETLQVVGHSASDEADGAGLADLRAKMVAGLLINRYEVDPKKISMSSSAGGGATVELVLARNN